jgi:hypothetical protein
MDMVQQYSIYCFKKTNNIQYISTNLQCKYVTEIKPTGYPVFKRYIVKLELTDTQIIF